MRLRPVHLAVPLVFFVTLVVARCGPERPPPSPPPTARQTAEEAQNAAFARLRTESSIRAEVSVERDGSVRFARFNVPTATGTDSVDRAFGFLERYRDLYRLREPRRELVPEHVASGGDGDTQVHFTQRIGTVPVEGSWLRVHILNGRVRSTAGRYLVALPALAPPSLNEGAARERATAFAANPGVRAVLHPPRLVAYAPSLLGGDPREAIRPAWRVVLAARDGVARVLFDAATGAALTRETLRNDQVRPPYPTNYLISDAHNGTSRIEDDECKWDNLAAVIDQFGAFADQDRRLCPMPPPPGCSQSCPTPPGLCVPCCVTFHPEPPPEARDLDPNLRATWDYYATRFRHYGWNAWGMRTPAVVVAGYNPANAAYEGGCDVIAFSSRMERPRDVAAHEYTHAVIAYGNSRLRYRGQSGALNESLADTFGALVNRSWQIGRDTPRSGCMSDGNLVLRDMSDPRRCGHPDHMNATISGDAQGFRAPANTSGTPCVTPGSPSGCCDMSMPQDCNDNWGVHTNSGIPNHAAWLLIGDPDDGDGAPVVEHTHRGTGVRVRGIGARKARALFYTVMTGSRLGNSAGFDAFRREMIEQARLFRESTAGYPNLRDLAPFTDEDVCAVRNAYAAVGLGSLDATCNGIEDTAEDDPDQDGLGGSADGGSDGGVPIDNCPLVANPAQTDTDGDRQGDVCDPDPDNDTVRGTADNCPLAANLGQLDTDNDRLGDACDDQDCANDTGDGVPWSSDNCPRTCNPKVRRPDGTSAQLDTDTDGIGDACDNDADNDGVLQPGDNCWLARNFNQSDGDRDGVGDACDNCPTQPNRDQANDDGDATGNACDPDPDNDGVNTIAVPGDNCPVVYNPEQADGDRDGVGAACDADELMILRGAASDVIQVGSTRPGGTLRIDLPPCRSSRCLEPPCLEDAVCARQNRMDQGGVRFRVSTARETWARVVDDQGYTVASSAGVREHALEFTPWADAFWRAADGLLSARAYRIEVWSPSRSDPALGDVRVERVLTAFTPPDGGAPDASVDATVTPDVTVTSDAGDSMDAGDVAPPPDVRPDIADIATTPDTPLARDVTDVVSCAAGQTMCARGCADLDLDTANCGACARACAPRQGCSFGVCRATCDTGLTLCPVGDVAVACVSTSIDRANCGACGTVCPSGQVCGRACSTCAAGCVDPGFCTGGLYRCGELCVDLASDARHCGACNAPCALPNTCRLGLCRAPAA
jgi:hypothetical protein